MICTKLKEVFVIQNQMCPQKGMWRRKKSYSEYSMIYFPFCSLSNDPKT